MKYLATFYLLISIAAAQQVTDKPLIVFDRAADNLEATTITLPAATRVAKTEAFEKVFVTTETLVRTITRTVYAVNEAGEITSRTQTIQRWQRVPTTKFYMRMKAGYFVSPLDGKTYRRDPETTTTLGVIQ